MECRSEHKEIDSSWLTRNTWINGKLQVHLRYKYIQYSAKMLVDTGGLTFRAQFMQPTHEGSRGSGKDTREARSRFTALLHKRLLDAIYERRYQTNCQDITASVKPLSSIANTVNFLLFMTSTTTARRLIPTHTPLKQQQRSTTC